jgi:predicted anti-sigma-YlaC factor YlaD
MCPRSDIAAYIDGELKPAEELALEAHLAICKICARELNEQKIFLSALNATLEREDEVDLPKDFTKVIVTSAESRVSGLRRSGERFNAVFICGALLLFVLFGLGGEAVVMMGSASNPLDQAFSVLGMAGHMFYNLVLGTTLILSSISSQLVFGSAGTLFLLAILFCALAVAFSRLMLRYNRTS